MKRNQVQQARIHFVDSPDGKSIEDHVNEFHAKVIESRIQSTELSSAQKLAVLDLVLEELAQLL